MVNSSWPYPEYVEQELLKEKFVNLEKFAYIKPVICQECGSSDFHYKNSKI
jgi:hypothetical protein